MKKALVIFIFSWSVHAFSAAGPLTEAEAKEFKAEITHMMGLFEKGDAQALFNHTHESIYSLVGGSKESFERLTKSAVEQILEIKFLESQLGEPSEVYAAGKYELCFVPRVSIMQVQGKKVKSTGFLIAARTVGE